MTERSFPITMEALSSALRPLLQPVTHNFPDPVRNFFVSLLGPRCYHVLLYDVNLADAKCLKFGISKALGLGIIGASAVVKIPQLLKILNAQSGEGISFLSYVLETLSYTINLAYNVRQGFPFSTYGETALIAMQNVAISLLVLHYAGKDAAAAVFVAGVATTAYALTTENVVDRKLLSYLQAGAGVLGVASKVPQVWTIWRQGGTGQLSAFAVSRLELSSSLRYQPLTGRGHVGLQLSCRLAVQDFHNAARGGRQAHSLRLCGRFHAQRSACWANALLLEQPVQQENAGS